MVLACTDNNVSSRLGFCNICVALLMLVVVVMVVVVTVSVIPYYNIGNANYKSQQL